MLIASRGSGEWSLLSLMLLGSVTYVASAGCRPTAATVTGSVRLDGQPLEAGTVVFHATDGNYRETQGAEVTDGRYRIDRLPIKAMDVETTRANDITPLGPRLRVQLKAGPQVFDIDMATTPATK